MDVIELPGRLPDFVRYLTRTKVLRYRPLQVDEGGALGWADGVEIILVFNQMHPERFRDLLPLILQTAEYLVGRYDARYYGGRFEVDVIGDDPLPGRGRRRRIERRTFGASLFADPTEMVWGDGPGQRSLLAMAQRIVDIADQYSPGFWVRPGHPVMVRELRLNVREPLRVNYRSRRERLGLE